MRYLRDRKWRCEVIAPSRLTRSPVEQRVKTDRRDALLLARELRSGNLTSIVVPDERDEAIRDLTRAREDAVAARLRIRLQMKAMLLKHGCDYVRFRSWSQAHERHLSTIRFDHPAQEIAFNEYRLACKEASERVERITAALRKAQLRLSKRWRSLAMRRKLNHDKICIAIARELAGFIWDIGRHVTLRT